MEISIKNTGWFPENITGYKTFQSFIFNKSLLDSSMHEIGLIDAQLEKNCLEKPPKPIGKRECFTRSKAGLFWGGYELISDTYLCSIRKSCTISPDFSLKKDWYINKDMKKSFDQWVYLLKAFNLPVFKSCYSPLDIQQPITGLKRNVLWFNPIFLKVQGVYTSVQGFGISAKPYRQEVSLTFPLCDSKQNLLGSYGLLGKHKRSS